MKWLVFVCLVLFSPGLYSQPVPVEINTLGEGQFQLLRGGQPYYIKGAGGSDYLGRLQEYGGNSIRTWGTDENTIDLLDSAHSLGITVCMGLWVGHQQHGFDYDNEARVQEQFDRFREMVLLYKDHPAVLMWGIGNEVELGVSSAELNLKVWDAINDISLMIHAEDGNHPTLTVTAGISTNKAQTIMERAPDLDLIGVNAYGGIGSVPQTLRDAGWDKPYTVTEWGPNGQWEVSRTSWGAAIEQSSTEKAVVYADRYQNVILNDTDMCLGSYVFLWSEKFEETPTWYGLFLSDGTETEAIDKMQQGWTGTLPDNLAPRILDATVEGKRKGEDIRVTKDYKNRVLVEAMDPDGDPLTYEYILQPETGNAGLVNDGAFLFPYLPGLIETENPGEITFNAPENHNNYRLFIIVRDDQNNSATINIPFQVELAPLVSDDPNLLYPSKDAYVRDGDFRFDQLGRDDFERLQTRYTATADDGLNRRTYVGFDIRGIDRSVEHATFSLYGGQEEGAEVALYGVEFNWSENILNWNGQDDLQGWIPLDTIVLTEEEKYFHWEVTSYVNNSRYFGKEEVTFLLTNLNETRSPVNWASRETRPNPPKLELTLGEGPIILGRAEIGHNTLSIYPIPSPGHLIVNLEQPIKGLRFELFDLTGNHLWTLTAAEGVSSHYLHLEEKLELGGGLFLLKLTGRDFLQTRRIILLPSP